MSRVIFLLIISIFAALVTGCAFVTIPLLSGPKPLEEKVLEGKGKKILIVDITGTISEREKAGGLLAKGASSMVDLTREVLKKAEEDSAVVGVIIRINSPGGTVTASDIIRHDIIEFKNHKKVPVYACIMSIGTSGGYYIATAADSIIAHPTAITGSIGVLLWKFNVEGLLDKVGIHEQTIKSGDKKDILSPFRQSTPEEQKLVQAIIDQLYQRFLDVVISRPNNSLSRSELQAVADGRIFTASQALAAKLIDKTGYLDDAITDMKKQLNLDTAKVVIYDRPGSYKGSIYSQTSSEAGLSDMLGMTAGIDFLSESQFMYLWRP